MGAPAGGRGGGRRKGGEVGSSCRGRRGARWLPAARAPRLPGTHQAANGSAEVYSRWRSTAPCLPPPLPSVLRSQSRRRGARRWNGWSPDTHHHLSCAWEARGSAAPGGCAGEGGGGLDKAGECGRTAPRAGVARHPVLEVAGARGGERATGTDFAFSSPGSLLLPFSRPDTGTCRRSFPDASALRLQEGRAARGAACGDPRVGKAEVPHAETWTQTAGNRTEAWKWGGRSSLASTSSLLWGVLMKGAKGPQSCTGSPRIGGRGVMRALQTG